MAFLGPPGVGKTSIARIVAHLLKKESILSTGTYTELNARDLIGQYVRLNSCQNKRNNK